MIRGNLILFTELFLNYLDKNRATPDQKLKIFFQKNVSLFTVAALLFVTPPWSSGSVSPPFFGQISDFCVWSIPVKNLTVFIDFCFFEEVLASFTYC